jgi:hypothetical protein
MSCNPCCPRPAGAVVGEPLESQLQNFISSFYGEVQVIQNADGSYSWILPCDLNNAIVDWPSLDGEGTACLYARMLSDLADIAQTFQSAVLVNARTYCVVRNVPFAGRIEFANWKLNSGTATFSVKINSTVVTGLSALSATTTEATATATALNVFEVGDDLVFTLSAASSPVDFDLTLNIRRLPS